MLSLYPCGKFHNLEKINWETSVASSMLQFCKSRGKYHHSMVDMSVIGMNTKTLLYTHAVMYIKESLTEWSQGEGKYEWWGEMWYQQQKERKIERGLHQVKVFLLNHKTSKTNLHKVCIFIQHNLQICCFLLCIIMNIT